RRRARRRRASRRCVGAARSISFLALRRGQAASGFEQPVSVELMRGALPTSMDLAAFLAHHGIVAQRVEHPPVMTVEESERLVPPLPGAKTKNLFLRNKKGDRHFLVTVPHDVAVDLIVLGDQLGAGRLGFASPERLMKHLGITPGSV